MRKVILVGLFFVSKLYASEYPKIILEANQSGIYYDYHLQQTVEVTCRPSVGRSYCYCKYTHAGMNTYLYELTRVEANGTERTLEIFSEQEKVACNTAMTNHPACK